MNKNGMIKAAAVMAVGIGVNNVIANVASNAEPEDTKGLTKAFNWIGVGVISYVIVSKLVDYVEPKIEGAIEHINGVIKKVKEELK